MLQRVATGLGLMAGEVAVELQDPLEARKDGESAAITKVQAAVRGQQSRKGLAPQEPAPAPPLPPGSAVAAPVAVEVKAEASAQPRRLSKLERRASETVLPGCDELGRRATDVVDGSIDTALRENQEGRLTIKIIRGNNMINCDADAKGRGMSDPFCLVKVPGRKRFRTKVKMDTLNPVWNQKLEVKGKLGVFLKEPMKVSVYDHDYLTLNDPMGSVEVSLQGLLGLEKLHFDDLALRGVAHGTISFTVKFTQEEIRYAFPSPVAASAHEALDQEAPQDATRFEARRDATLRALGHPFFKWATIAFMVGVGSWICFLVVLFPLKLEIVPWTALGWSEKHAKEWWMVVNQCVTGFFSYQNGTTIPWRASLAHHLWFSHRSSETGLDFYGRPTESMFFHIPRKPRGTITLFLILAVVFHFISQFCRFFLTTYEEAEEPPGNMIITLTFLPSIVFALGAGFLQARELKKLQALNPARFPPSAVLVALANFRKRVKGGEGCCGALKASLVEFKEIDKGQAHLADTAVVVKAKRTSRRDASRVPAKTKPTAEVGAAVA